MRERENARNPFVTVELKPPLQAAVKLGAEQNFTTVSDYVRRALVRQLRNDGINPHDIAVSHRVADEARP